MLIIGNGTRRQRLDQLGNIVFDQIGLHLPAAVGQRTTAIGINNGDGNCRSGKHALSLPEVPRVFKIDFFVRRVLNQS